MRLCGHQIASTAVCTLPSVAFLNPTGADSAEAIAGAAALHRARADRAQVTTRRNTAASPGQDFGCRGNAHAGAVEQDTARAAQARADIAASVQVRIVDQALPSMRVLGFSK